MYEVKAPQMCSDALLLTRIGYSSAQVASPNMDIRVAFRELSRKYIKIWAIHLHFLTIPYKLMLMVRIWLLG